MDENIYRLLLWGRALKRKGYHVDYFVVSEVVTMTTSIAPSNNKLVSMTPFQTQCILNLCIVNNIPTDDLVSRGARASVAMVLTYFSQNTLVSTPEGLTFIPTKRHE